jgi:tetratricopeptide (TPR) repeat protein
VKIGSVKTLVRINPIQGRRLAGLLLFMLPVWAAAQTNPAGFDNVVRDATAARERDDVPRSIALYSEALRLKPEWPDGWWFLGSLQYEAEGYSAGRDALTRYIDLVPDGGPAWALRGLCEFETAEYAKSLADLQRGLSLGAARQPSDENFLRFHEALLLTRSGSFERALQEYALLARRMAPNPELLIGLGLAGLRTPLLPRELRADKRDLFMAAGHAAFLFLSGDETGAQREFQDLFRRFPTAANAHYLYGYLLFPTDADEAIIEFRRELEVAPSNAAVEQMLAWDSLMRNEFPEALAHTEKALAEEPSLTIARLVQGRALVETGRLKDGLAVLEKESQLEPDNLEIHLALAKAYSESGRKEDARRERLLCFQIEKNAKGPEASR